MYDEKKDYQNSDGFWCVCVCVFGHAFVIVMRTVVSDNKTKLVQILFKSFLYFIVLFYLFMYYDIVAHIYGHICDIGNEELRFG